MAFRCASRHRSLFAFGTYEDSAILSTLMLRVSWLHFTLGGLKRTDEVVGDALQKGLGAFRCYRLAVA